MNNSSSRMNLSTLILIGAGMGYSSEGAQELSVEQRVHRIVEWIKTSPTVVEESDSASQYFCSSSKATSSRVIFKDGDKEFVLRYCDDGERGKIESEDMLITEILFPVKIRYTQIDKIVSRTRNTVFYDGGLNGFHPEKEKWSPYEWHGVSTHRECVTGWLGTEYVGHLEVGGISPNPEQDRKERQKVQDQYLLVLNQIEAFIPKATIDSYL